MPPKAKSAPPTEAPSNRPKVKRPPEDEERAKKEWGHPDGKDLSEFQEDSYCDGTVTNVGRFGVFVDIGAKKDGLLRVPIKFGRGYKRGMEVQGMKVISVSLDEDKILLEPDESTLPEPPPRSRSASRGRPARGGDGEQDRSGTARSRSSSRGRGKGKGKGMRAQMSGPYHGGYGGPGSVNPRPEPVENPGLDATKHTYVGTLKRRMNTKHGYTFIVSEEISTAFPAKDAYLHATACPWVEYMELDQDDVVSFNVEDKNGSPQVVRIVKGKP